MLKGKNPGIDCYSGCRKNGHGGGGGQIEILQKNPGIDFYSGLRKNAQGGVKFEILKKIQV